MNPLLNKLKESILTKFIVAKESHVVFEVQKDPLPTGEKNNSVEQADKKNKVENVPFTLDSGAIYTGQWLSGQRHGVGSIIWPDGSKYSGEWRNDKANGKGELKHRNGDVYSGDWVDARA